MRFLLLALLALSGCAEARPEHSQPYAVRLEFTRGLCSGTVVGRDLILSASHCWEGGNRLLKVNGSEAYALEIVHDGKDHALVRVTQHFTRWAVIGKAPKQGDRVSFNGNAAAEPDLYREGYVVRATDDEILIDAQGFGGDSGAGVYGGRGSLVAVVSAGKVWTSMGGQRLAFTVAWPLAFTDEQWAGMRGNR